MNNYKIESKLSRNCFEIDKNQNKINSYHN